MTIDVTPNTVATNALQALDFSSLIGGPMDAIVKAQALAAKTTYEFINEVGLTIDPDTNEKKPVNVSFTYNNNGQEATLTVPLLSILTIPSIEVTEFVIDFIANISASSSSTTETSSDTELGVDASAEATLGIGPFSIKVNAKANYSSKQHSKAAQDSKYSVEYTMNVNVKGGQSGMPAGLQTVLNILQESSSSVSADEILTISPANLNFDQVQTATLQITLKDNQGYLVKGGEVKLKVEGDSSPFEAITVVKGIDPVAAAEAANALEGNRSADASLKSLMVPQDVAKAYRRKIKANQSILLAEDAVSEGQGVTGRDGSVTFKLELSDEVFTGADTMQGRILVTATVPISNTDKTFEEVMVVTYSIVPDSDPSEGTDDEPPVEATPADTSVTAENKTTARSSKNKKES